MRIIKLLPIMALGLITACDGNKQAQLHSGVRLENLDTIANPGTDFYQYAVGGWKKNNPLKDEYSMYGTFAKMDESNREQIKDLICGLAEQTFENGSIGQKVSDMYAIAMDSVKLNKEGALPIQEDLAHIVALKDSKKVYGLLAELNKLGANAYLALFVGADDKDSKVNAVQIYQSGLSMGEREYYLDNDENSLKIRKAFREHVVKMFGLLGWDKKKAENAMEIVMDIETSLAKTFRTNVELRNPEANYNKMGMDEIKQKYASFDWNTYLSTLGLKDVEHIIVGQPEALQGAVDLLAETPVSKQVVYLQWKLLDAAAGFLSDDFVTQNFDFYKRTMMGTKEMEPRWKRAVAVTGSVLGEAVGQMYVEKYFPAEAKERMIVLVKHLQESLADRIEHSAWMSEATKAKALEKLAAFHVKIGYPDKWKDYTNLVINKDSYWANVKRASIFSYTEMLNKAGNPVDKDEWFMTPQTINAYYNPTTNEICFPAGILQYPFFDMNADDAANYGAIGVVIGHEMTHGFDDQGRRYDKDGNMNDWWTAVDAENFEKRTKVLSDFFDAIEVAPGVHANGKLTLGENIADHGGLQVAYQAFQKAMQENPLEDVDGFTPNQRFFISYATVWAANIRPEMTINLTKSDVHSLPEWRVNGALPHISAWYDAFGITASDSLFLPEEKRVSIW